MTEPASRTTRPTRGRAAAPPAVAGGERYALVEELGRGAWGVVWRARDRALDREVAVKVLHDRFLGAADQARLADEARAMARLSHPNVVAVYDVGEREGRAFVAMELVRGEALSRWLATPRPWRDVVRVFVGVGEGLAAAHARGLVHRDVKPGNILLGDDGRPRLADFGVAHVGRDAGAPATTATATAGPIGSPAYMPPERLGGDGSGPRGDQFGFCAALYEALHGRLPFTGATAGELAEAMRRGPPPPARSVPRWLHAIVARGLAADPAARFPSMDAVVAALRAGARRRWFAAGAVGVALGAGAVIAMIAAGGAGRAARAPDAPGVAAPADDEAPAPVAGVPDEAPAEVPAPAAPDAGVATDEAAPPDEPPPAPRRPRPAREPDPAAGLSVDEARARYLELRRAWGDAIARGDLAGARTIAGRAVPYGRRLGTPEPQQVVTVMSCRLGDERRARAALAALPRGTPQDRYLREEMVRACRHHGMELGDALE